MYLIYIIAVVLVGCGRAANVNRHMKLLEIENHIDKSVVQTPQSKRFITITKRPGPHSVHRPGTTLELTCEAIAAPAPAVHWFRNDAPIYEYDKESNEIMDTNPTSVARVASTLLITRSDTPAEYSCLIVSGMRTARASTIVYSTDGSTEITERSKLVPLSPRILVSYKVFVDTIGSNIVLPCRVKGHPRPVVVWRDKDGVVIENDSRMKVLRSGELVITSLLWSDMGEFTCRASNLFGSTQIKTFVYPARPNETDG
ncbi:neural/ectodermal development factor IMP-L2-like [Vanessa cardui]|uniref:neural/ectodermal development factor IMP-L2-like n=1 Tax=Vanessa cardui TaxID=171605 RepID=UPI001F13DFD1|nr:neural/ectodermal development factor IMP-L2-like [Vanessa cardui]XP_046974455.1 neural/ectodermal development factor IMP-L2-like [Vanessa cardui]